jgi:hypothetical protein
MYALALQNNKLSEVVPPHLHCLTNHLLSPSYFTTNLLKKNGKWNAGFLQAANLDLELKGIGSVLADCS